MAIILDSGEHSYEVIENWGRLPEAWRYGEVAAVGVDSTDDVYVFARCEHPMMVFDCDGNFRHSWSEGLFKRPHGVAIDSRGDIYVGEVSRTAMRNRGTPLAPGEEIRCMQKLVRLVRC